MTPTSSSIRDSGQKEQPENRRNSKSLDWECCVCRKVTYYVVEDSASSFCAGNGLCNHQRCSQCLDVDGEGSRHSASDIPTDDEGNVLCTLHRNEEVLAVLASRRRGKRSEAGSENASRGGSSKGSGSIGRLGSFDREVMEKMSGIDLHEGENGNDGALRLEGLLRTVREREILGLGRRRDLKERENEQNKPEGDENKFGNGEEIEVGSAESDGGLWMLGARKLGSKKNTSTEISNLGTNLLSRGLKDLEITGQSPESDSDDRSGNMLRYRNPDFDEDEDATPWDGKNSDGKEVERVDILEFSRKEKERKEKERKEKDKKCKKKDAVRGMKTEKRSGDNVYRNALYRAAGLF